MFPQKYMIRRKVLAFLGAKFHIKDMSGAVIAFSHQKAFKLKEDIRIYSDETMSRELLTIKARNIIDFSAAYDVTDPATGASYGTWRRKGFSSLLRDSWELLVNEVPVAQLKEDGMALALIRRFFCNLIPQSYHLTGTSGAMLANYSQHFNPFIFKLDVTNMVPGDERMEKLIAAGAILLTAIEGRQN